MDEVDSVLQHYGVKGMKWGQRRASRTRPSGPAAVTTKITPGKRVKTAGGERHAPHEDAVKAAVARQKARKSTVDSLSNDELKDLVKRMQMEQQLSALSAGRQNKGLKFVTGLLGGVGRQQAQVAANQVAGAEMAKLLAKAGYGKG